MNDPRPEKLCPACRHWIDADAPSCQHCGERLDAEDPDYVGASAVSRPDDESDPVGYGFVLILMLTPGWLCGVGSFAITVLGLLCLPMGFFTCGMTWVLAFALAMIGLPVSLASYWFGTYLCGSGRGMEESFGPHFMRRAGRMGLIYSVLVLILGMMFLFNRQFGL